uniref:DNA replication licensing factor MCM7 n=1 Tax=Syphacia muris TaxID=451379 RepID=A0A158R579_9BILA
MPAINCDFDKDKENIRDFLTTFYYDNDDGSKVFPYMEQIEHIAEREQITLYINLDDVFEHDPGLVEAIRENAQRYHRLFCDVVDDLIQDHLGDRQPTVRDALDAFIFQRVYMDRIGKETDAQNGAVNDIRRKYPPDLLRRFEVAFKERASEKCLSVRELKAFHVGRLVTVSGIVIRATEVKPSASVITYTCDTCGCETYQPVKGPSFIPALNCPSKDCIETKAHGRLIPQIRGSKFLKFQEIRLQEVSDQVPVGGVPRAISVNVYGECTRACSPGDEISITGVLLPLMRSGFKQLVGGLCADVALEAHYIENINAVDSAPDDEGLSDEEIELIAQENFYDLLAKSIAPEIYGHLDVKKSLLLALVGGVDKLTNGMKIRGCINILLMGDPGVAKSQLLSYVDRLALRSQYTTGRGSSGVGLTAAVMKDLVTGEMVLEGGALVLADKGICCIDEFDKMMESDRTAIHEVMEQQTISIAKAGIMTTLNARVSVIAAANPAFGRYNPQRSVEQNVNLPAALLSRFDLIWLIQDKPDRESDKELAKHVTFVHMFSHEPEVEGGKPLPMETIRKYIALCKKKQPVLEEKLKDRLVTMYVELRKEARVNKDTTYISPRSLLAVIRMSTALARLRLADKVNESDISEAIRLLEACKESFRPELEKHRDQMSPVERAFSVIRDLYEAAKEKSDGIVPLQAAKEKCIARGISVDTLEQCIEEYSSNGVLMVDGSQRIIFTVS